MKISRRKVLKHIGVLAGGSALSQHVLAAKNNNAFGAKSVTEALDLLNVSDLSTSDGVVFNAPEIAENGAVVPLVVASTLPGTTRIALLVDKNPTPLAAVFKIPEGTKPEVTTRVKMRETSQITAVVTANGKQYRGTKEIKVTLGGCGG